MFARSSDRNLLVGILALQMDFVGRDQLVAAMNRWVLDKERFLEDILLEQNALTTDTRKLLAALVEKHLEMHGHDAQKSLQAVSSIGPIRNELKSIADVDVEASLAQVSIAQGNDDGYATKTFTVSTSTSQGERFCVLRLHNKGGLGAVYVARDAELNREVALKEIKHEFADDTTSRERFLVEAEITGGLEHPGIVPVYGLGQYDDGRPFYAMRFVRGESLKEAIATFHKPGDQKDQAKQRLEFRNLLGRFVDVCHAIEYAHKRGVLHRDLKPGNIMLGKYGETLVVDWGLAKTMDDSSASRMQSDEPPLRAMSSSGSTATRMGSRLGTPAYMSPEQAAGRLDRLNATSDVYCLGGTLYALLTGEPAFADKTPDNMARQIERGEFPNPRERNPQIPLALQAICLKAMALEQSDRYQSAAHLAADVERWLADEPVSAWAEPISVRAGRWMRRHRTFVSSTAAALMAAFAILSVSVVVVSNGFQRELAARELAEENLSIAKQAVDTMLTQIGDEELADVPQMEEIRRELLEKANKFYERFSDQKPNDPGARLDVALAWRRVGDIYRLLQNKDQGVRAYKESIQRLSELSKEYPDVAMYQQELANTHNWLGVLLKHDDLDGAEDEYDQAIQLQETLCNHDGANPAYRQEHARSLYNRAIVHFKRGNNANAQNGYEQAIKTLKALIQDNPQGKEATAYEQELARCYNNLAIVLKRIDKRAAISNYDTSIKMMGKVVSSNPRNREYKWELAQYYNNRANAQHDVGELNAAEDSNSEAVRLLDELAEAIPRIRSERGNSLHSRGIIRVDLEKSDQAKEDFDEEHVIFVKLVKDFAKDPQYLDRLGNARQQLAWLEYDRGGFQQAATLTEKAINNHHAALELIPENKEFLEHLQNGWYLRAWCYMRLGEYNEVGIQVKQFLESFPASKHNGEMTQLISEVKGHKDLSAHEKLELIDLLQQIMNGIP